jgi:hypothetical protein
MLTIRGSHAARFVPPSACFWRSSDMWHRADWQTEQSQTECFYVLVVWCLDVGAFIFAKSSNRQSFIYLFMYYSSNDFFRSSADVVSNETKLQTINYVDRFHLPRRDVRYRHRHRHRLDTQKICKFSITVAGLRAEIWTWDLLNAELRCSYKTAELWLKVTYQTTGARSCIEDVEVRPMAMIR